MAARKKTTKSKKKLDIKVRMIGELIDVTGSSKDSWNPAEISDDLKAISYIRKLADTWNPAQLNEALKYLGFATIDSWNPAIIEETKNKLVKYFLPTDASGNPIELDLKGSLPYEVTALTIDLLPIQDLSQGEPSPTNICPISGRVSVEVKRTGKNRLENTATSITNNGITFTVNTDGSVTCNGTATANSNIYVNGNSVKYFGNTLFNGCPSGGSSTTYFMEYYDTNAPTGYRDYGNGVAIPAETNGHTCRVVILIRNGTTVNNLTFKPMIRSSSIADDTYEPYQGETVTVQFGQTVYGGNLDFVNGGLSNEWGYIASYNGETLPREWISDRDVYAPNTTPTNGAEVAYKLATPTEITITPKEISLLKGNNILTTDGDNINITYKAILNS